LKITVLKSKLHGVKVTETRVDYPGSIGIDEELMEAAGIHENEKVLVVNLSNGARWETYAIPAARKSRVIAAQGGSAKLCKPGDELIVMAFTVTDDDKPVKPRVVSVTENKKIGKI